MAAEYDKIIIGAGLYGLYAAELCARRGERVLVLEYEDAAFKRATFINQARVHQGYHYPRSLSTALKSAGYFRRFSEDYAFCINREFDQIYATSGEYSWSNAEQFLRFCRAAEIPCTPLCPDRYFKNSLCDGAFLTREYTYDAVLLRDALLEKLSEKKNAELLYSVRIASIEKVGGMYELSLRDGRRFAAPFVLNVTYASSNQLSAMLGFEPFRIKYELCEIILCDVNDALSRIGFTVMDGPFFSIMPFGKTGLHSLTSVTFTPHATSYAAVPSFPCQRESGGRCSETELGNCSECPARPESAFPYMSSLARKYLRDEFQFTCRRSLFSMKPILMTSEVDDSRPTVIRVQSESPTFVSVLSGKINTVYDLDEVLSNG